MGQFIEKCDCFVHVPNKVYKKTSRGEATGLTTREWSNIGVGASIYDDQAVRDFIADFDTTQTPTSSGLVTGLTSINTNTVASQRDIKLTEGVIEVITPVYLRYSNPNTGALLIELGTECGQPEELFFANGDFQSGRVTNSILLSVGFYRIKIWNFDTDGSFNNLTAQYSTDNVNFANESGTPPYFNFYQDGECTYCIPLIYDKCNKVYLNMNTMEVVDLGETSSCEPNAKAIVEIEDCEGIKSNVNVDSIVGTYSLDAKYKHTERVYDNVTSNFEVTITALGLNTSSLSFSFSSVSSSGWVFGNGYLVDFGNGFTDIDFTPNVNYSNEQNGRYEVKIYTERLLPEGRFYYLLGNLEVIVTNGIITTINPNIINASRFITRTVAEVFQDYCNGELVGTPYLANGTPYTLQGVLSATYFEEKSDWLGMSDANNGGSLTQTPAQVTPIYAQNRTVFTANTNPASYTVATIANSREITVQNLTGADVDIRTSQGQQVVAARGTIVISNPKSLDINHTPFSGNITVVVGGNVQGNISGVSPRIIINQKGYA